MCIKIEIDRDTKLSATPVATPYRRSGEDERARCVVRHINDSGNSRLQQLERRKLEIQYYFSTI